MSLFDLPIELLIQILFLLHDEQDLCSLTMTHSLLRSLVLTPFYQANAESLGDEALTRYAQHGKLDRMQYLIDQGISLTEADPSGRMALSVAAEHGHHAIVQLLLDRGADPNEIDDRGYPALTLAATHGHTTIVQLLLDRGADVSAECQDNLTALHYAAYAGRLDVVRHLIANGADVDLMALDGADYSLGTPLTEAARGGQAAVAALLLEHGANVNAVDDGCMAPLHHAARAGWGIPDRASVREEYRGAQQKEWVVWPGDLVWGPGPGAYIDWLHGDETTFVRTPGACDQPRDYLATVKVLVAHGARLTMSEDLDLENPLLSAAWGGEEDIVQFLLAAGAEVNGRLRCEFRYSTSTTPLHAAAHQGTEAVVKVLLAHGAHVHATDRKGRTALGVAKECRRAEVIQLLNAAQTSSHVKRPINE